LRRCALALAVVAAQMHPALAQTDEPDGRDSAAIRDCLKSRPDRQDSCIGLISYPCLDDGKKMQTTADMVGCSSRERLVWNKLLDDAYRRLRGRLDTKQQAKLGDMQRAWIASREKSCNFYWDYFQGTLASPMIAACFNEETARRALFLHQFLNDGEGK
jgi:uncharacterized protein YecT (DUF1311 family)